MKRRLLLAALLLLPACTGGGGDDVAPLPTIQTLPPEASPTPLVPTRTDQIPAQVLPSSPPGVVEVSNNDDATLTGGTASVTVPAGQRLQVIAVCQGARTLEIRTEPDSVVEANVECEPSEPGQLTVRQPRPLEVTTTYRIVVRAPAPLRYVVGAAAVPVASDPVGSGDGALVPSP